MRFKLIAGSSAVGAGVSIALLWALSIHPAPIFAAPASELHVCPSGCPYASVQSAVDAASDDDVIKVAAGIYMGVSARAGMTQMVYLDKPLTIQGGYTTSNWITPEPAVNLTILDAQGQGRVFYVSLEGFPTIAGLRITGGNATNQGRGDAGGGIYAEINVQIAPPASLIADNTIYGNTAQDGGGVYLDQGAPFALRGNTIVSNTAVRAGGGMVVHNVEVTLLDNVFAGNNASFGGGLDLEYSDAVLQGNTFRDNHAQTAGGGVFVFNSTARLNASVVVSNTAQRGAGLAVFGRQDWRESAWSNTLLADNQASLEGTGLYVSGVPLRLGHTTLARNGGGDGSGIFIGSWNPWSTSGPSTLDMRDTIVATQTVGVVVADASALDINGVLWHNIATPISQVPGASVSIQNALSGDPQFLNPAAGDYHLGASSAARDAGIPTATPRDLDGQIRPMGLGYDLGADEYLEAALSLVKTPALSGVNVGQWMVYTLIVTSSGSLDAHNVIFTDTLDVRQRPILVQSALGNCALADVGWGGTVVCAPGTLQVGHVITVTLTAETSAATPMGRALTNTVAARANEAANTASATVYAQDCHARIGDGATEYPSVQAAVDAAAPGALLKVAGTCMGVYGPEGARQQVLLEQKSLAIQGGYTLTNWTTPNPAANPTILDARGLGRVFFIYRPPVTDTTLIDGLRLTGGNAYGQIGGHSPLEREASRGGGVYVFGGGERLVFSNNHILSNTAASDGGGISTSFTENHVFARNTFAGNSTLGDGGGLAVHAGAAILSGNVFDSNSAEKGGGFAAAAAASASFSGDRFVGNSARSFGGGLALEMGPVLSATVILSNTAERGGGLAFYAWSNPWNASASLINTVIAGNQANVDGAGMFVPPGMTVYLLQTTLAGNTGGDGAAVTQSGYPSQAPGASTVMLTNTIVASQSVGLRVTDASTAIVNGVLWNNMPQIVAQSPEATVSIQNSHAGAPAFVNPAAGDYHLSAGSAARDAGIDNGVMQDIDGQVRPMGLGWDLGADEYPAPALGVSKWPSAPYVNRGEVMTYILTVTNIGAGAVSATGVVLTDTLDDWQRAVTATAATGSCVIANPGWGGSIVCAPGALSAGARVMMTFSVEVSGATPLRQAMLNAVLARSSETRSAAAQAATVAQDCHARINAGSTDYSGIQSAVDAAGADDLVKVAGTCLGVIERAGLRQQVYLDKSLTLRGGFTPTNWAAPDPTANPTVLDALGGGRVLYVTGPISPTIEGLRITGGDAAGLAGVDWGWDAGGGVYVISATATISGNWIHNNTAGGEFTLGGGLFVWDGASLVINNTVYSNTARYGGGVLALESPVALSHNAILSNTALKGGGGVTVWGTRAGTLLGNLIRGNRAGWTGGGLSLGASGSAGINNVIVDNAAEASGSAIYFDGPAVLWHTTIARNTGGDGSGVYVAPGEGTISVGLTNTILAEQGIGISVTAGNTVTVNGILWHNTPITISKDEDACVTVNNALSGNPLFGPDGYHLTVNSAAIDTGVVSGVADDIDGRPRPRGQGYDLGADEFWWEFAYLPRVMR